MRRRTLFRYFVAITICAAFGNLAKADFLAVSWFGDAYIIDEDATVVASEPTGFYRLNSLARDSDLPPIMVPLVKW